MKPTQIGDQNEEKDAEDEREKAHAGFARRRAHHAGDEFVGHLAKRLHPGRNARSRPAP